MELCMEISEPNPGFIVIVNCKGGVVDYAPANHNIAEVSDLILYLNNNFPSSSPHSAWKCNGSFLRIY